VADCLVDRMALVSPKMRDAHLGDRGLSRRLHC
jgi:hypothetical protein